MKTLARVFVMLLFAGSAAYAAPGCLHVLKQSPVFCPKCSDPAAGGGTAGNKISANLCRSCGFYCWYTLTKDGGEYTLLPKSTAAPFSPISETDGVGCKPSDAERERVLGQAIPVALHMKREDFERLATDDPIAAAAISMMLWRGDDTSMTDAREFIVQFKGMPSYKDAMALFDDYDERVAKPWSIALQGEDFLHVEVAGDRTREDRVQLTIRSTHVSGTQRKSVGVPAVVHVSLDDEEVPTSFAGQLVVAREGVASYGR